MMLAIRKKPVAPPDPPSEARSALAEAITNHKRRIAEDQTRNTALTRATAALSAANEASWKAETVVEQTPELMREWMLASARGDKVDKPLSIKDARSNLEAAEIERDAANHAVTMMRAEVDKFSSGKRWSEEKLRTIAAGIVHDAPATAMLISEALELRRQLNEKLQILTFIDRLMPLVIGYKPKIKGVVERLTRPLTAVDDQDAGYEDVLRTDKIGPWARSFEALLTDAGAKIEIE